jgi:hypothetical protein
MKRVAFGKRFSASQRPFSAPYFRSASRAYSEQVGINRQDGGVAGDIRFL